MVEAYEAAQDSPRGRVLTPRSARRGMAENGINGLSMSTLH